jgi:hypothetical protein
MLGTWISKKSGAVAVQISLNQLGPVGRTTAVIALPCDCSLLVILDPFYGAETKLTAAQDAGGRAWLNEIRAGFVDVGAE